MLNHTVLIGRIGNEITLKATNSGTEVVSFSLAVQRNYSKDTTDWITVVAWKGTATTIANYFKKGDTICIEGSIQTRNYDDKDGKKVYITEVVAEKVHFVTSKKEATANTETNTSSDNPAFSDVDDFMPIADDDIDLPFN